MNHDEISGEMRDAFFAQTRQVTERQQQTQAINFTDSEEVARDKMAALDPSVQDRSSYEGEQEEIFVDVGSWEHVAKDLKAGSLIARKGWNGKGMFLFFVKKDWELSSDSVSPGVAIALMRINATDTLPFIAMKTADNKIVPWLASQSDLLATDWEVL